MRRAALAALLFTASPASAQKLKGFEGQFDKAPDAARKVVETFVETTAKLYEAGLEHGNPVATELANQVLSLPFLPFMRALQLPRNPRGVHRLSSTGHHVDDRVRGWGGAYRYAAENRLSYEAEWTAYLEERALYDLHLVGARAIGDLVSDEAYVLEYGLGVGGLLGRRHRGGLDVSLGGELRPAHRLFLYGRAGALLLEGGTLGDLRAGAGARVGRFELRAGYRALSGPFNVLGGPELAAAVRL